MTVAAGYWSIRQSRSSTAALGVLLLPFAGALSGLLAALFARLRRDPQPTTRGTAWLCLLASVDGEIEKQRGDREFLIAALETASVSEERLDQLSAHDDSYIVTLVASESQVLAENRNTPVAILRTIAALPEARGSLDRWFAGNPSAPHDVLDRIADSGDVHMLRSLLANAALDCGLLRKATARLGPADRNEVRSTDQALASLEARLCVAK